MKNQNSPMDKTETFEIRTEKGKKENGKTLKKKKKQKGTYQSRIIW